MQDVPLMKDIWPILLPNDSLGQMTRVFHRPDFYDALLRDTGKDQRMQQLTMSSPRREWRLHLVSATMTTATLADDPESF